ncbi:MAG: RagB/SusD family nutrient uptake outer membrane protein, partial [Tannerellaceae bacterium]|nr:RagB/SusD family nutrient uptake outer membrane protein [Tannerellaceae bacterium]
MNRNVFIISISILIMFSGCDSLLDTQDYTRKNTGNFPRSEEDAAQMLAGIYSTLNTDAFDPFFAGELASDDRLGGGGLSRPYLRAMDRMMNYGDVFFHYFWGVRYKGIYRANLALETLDNVTDWNSEESKNQVWGEVYYLRAFFYFELAQWFGEVPLVTSAAPVNLPKAPAEELYAFIASDLQKAIGLLSDKPYTAFLSGHATKWAAEALMARAFLFYTGYYHAGSLPLYEGGTIEKNQVVAWLEDCMNNSGHDLVSDFHNLWYYTNEFTAKDYPWVSENGWSWAGDVNEEFLFAVKYTNYAEWDIVPGPGYSFGSIAHFGLRMPNGYESTFPYGEGEGAGPVSPLMVREWEYAEPDDIRRKASILNVAEELEEYAVPLDEMEETGYWQRKFIPVNAYDEEGEVVNASWFTGAPRLDLWLDKSQDKVCIRFADVLLMHSELTGTAAGINRVRARAGLAPLSAYSPDALKRERRWELAFEGLRWFDLMRWGDAP